jgi:translation initiation factor 2B subunit (eIF-2B alpha/beta/delta family)
MRQIQTGIGVREQIFELVPPRKLDSCINEDGALPIPQLLARIQAMPLAKSWKGTISSLDFT